MVISSNTLPENVEALKPLFRRKEQELENLNNLVEQFKAQAESLQEQLNLLIAISIASPPALLAHVGTAKYADALPLYRQEDILKCAGIDLPRATLENWMLKLGELVVPLINLLRNSVLEYGVVQMDDDCRDTGGRAMQEQLPKSLCKF